MSLALNRMRRLCIVALVCMLSVSVIGGSVALAAQPNADTVGQDELQVPTEPGIVVSDTDANAGRDSTVEIAYNVTRDVEEGAISRDDLEITFELPRYNETIAVSETAGVVETTIPANTVAGGEHTMTASIGTQSTRHVATGSLSVETPVEIGSIGVNDTNVEVGEAAGITVSLRNTGDTTEQFTLGLYEDSPALDGHKRVHSVKTVDISGGTGKTVTMPYVPRGAGEYRTYANEQVAWTVDAYTRSAVTDVSLSETELDPGEALTVTTTVTNRYEFDEAFTLRFTSSESTSEWQESRVVTAAPGTSVHTDTLRIPEPGRYSLTVGDRTLQFRVGDPQGTPEEPPETTTPEPTPTSQPPTTTTVVTTTEASTPQPTTSVTDTAGSTATAEQTPVPNTTAAARGGNNIGTSAGTGPGFTAGVALVALVAGALLAIRRT